MRWALRAIALSLLMAACAQQPPERDSLPSIAELVDPPTPCAFLVGDGTGVVVDSVGAGSPSDGLLLPGDVLVGLDGAVLGSSETLLTTLDGYDAGETVTLTVDRDSDQLDVPMTLGNVSPITGRPLMGIAITTRYERSAPDEVDDGSIDAPFVATADVEGELFEIDPVNGRFARLGIPTPEGRWVARDGRMAYIEGDLQTTSSLVTDSERVVPFETGARPVDILGVVDDDVVVLTAEGEASFTVVRRSLDSDDPERWQRAVATDDGIPVRGFVSPDGEWLAVLLALEPDASTLAFTVWNASDGTAYPRSLPTDLEPTAMYGWFDDESLLIDGPDGLAALDIAEGVTTPVELSSGASSATRFYPLGDGQWVLMGRGRGLAAGTTGAGATRPLVDNCPTGDVTLG